MKTLILTLAVMLCAVTASAEEVPQPSGALVNYHFDNTIEDLTNWLTLQTYDPKTNSFSPVEDPKFAKDGGLVLDRYYTIDGLSLRRHSSQTLVVRLRIGKPVDDEGPILRFGSEDNVRKDGMYLFEADGKDIIIEGINSDTDERHRAVTAVFMSATKNALSPSTKSLRSRARAPWCSARPKTAQ